MTKNNIGRKSQPRRGGRTKALVVVAAVSALVLLLLPTTAQAASFIGAPLSLNNAMVVRSNNAVIPMVLPSPTSTSTSTTRTTRTTSSTFRLMLASKQQQQQQDDSGAVNLTPHPPDYPPSQDQVNNNSLNLQDDFDTLTTQVAASADSMESFQDQIQVLTKQLLQKEQALKQSRDDWSVEKTGLVAKIAEFTNIFQQQEQDADEAQDTGTLEKEIKLLQGQLTSVQQQMRQEKQAATQLKQRLGEVEDTMEFQQMEFTKEKKGLIETVEAEKKKLSSIQSKWKLDQQRFEQEKKEIEQQLKKEVARLQEAEQEWQRNQDDFSKEQTSMQDELVRQMSKLKWTEKELSSERTEFETERAALQDEIQKELTKVREMEATLKKEKQRFQLAQTSLERTIAVEQTKVADLSTRLEREQERFDAEKEKLEERIDAEQLRLTAMEEQLAKEQLDFSQERSILQERIEDEVRVGKLKKRLMNERYEKIREELTSLWQGAKREAREEQTKLMAKYNTQIAGLDGTIAELETDLSSARLQGDELQTMLKTVTEQKDRAILDGKSTEKRFTAMVSERNNEISTLKVNLNDLRTVVQEKEAKLQKYETSYRQVLKLSVQVTGNKIKASRSRVTGWIRRGRGSKQDKK